MMWVACSQQRQPCLDPVTASLIVSSVHFKSDTSKIPVDSSLPSAVFYPVTVLPNDTNLYSSSSAFILSLSPDTGFCQWLFSPTRNGALDTISFYYQRRLEFLSNACGFIYFYNLDSVRTTHKAIDSADILNATVNNNVNTKHVQIFIHPNY
jgi:hypothetical protein